MTLIDIVQLEKSFHNITRANMSNFTNTKETFDATFITVIFIPIL